MEIDDKYKDRLESIIKDWIVITRDFYIPRIINDEREKSNHFMYMKEHKNNMINIANEILKEIQNK